MHADLLQLRRDFDLADDGALEKFIPHREVFLDRVLDVLKRFFLGRALRPTTRQSWNGHAVAFVSLEQCDLVPHRSPPQRQCTRSCSYNKSFNSFGITPHREKGLRVAARS